MLSKQHTSGIIKNVNDDQIEVYIIHTAVGEQHGKIDLEAEKLQFTEQLIAEYS